MANNGAGGSSGYAPQGPVTRAGILRPGVTITEVPLADLSPLHSVPRPGVPASHIQDLMAELQTNGYDLAQPIPVARMPDGRFVTMGGHHRVEAMKRLGETTIPARIVDWNSINPGAQNLYRQWFPNFPWDDFIQ